LNISHTQAYYVLFLLKKKGLVVEHKVGRVAVWCAASVPATSRYTLVSPCFRYAEEALRRIIEGSRGAIRTLRPFELIKVMGKLHGRSCYSPHILAAAKVWLEERLRGAIVTVEREETRQTRFIVDVRKAKELIGLADYAA
jgi:hypothetical protein